MTDHIVVLSGRIASGKSTLAAELGELFGAQTVRTSALLRARGKAQGHTLDDRISLQHFGRLLDKETSGVWIAEEVERHLELLGAPRLLVVDSVRVSDQLTALRSRFGRRLLHVHLMADGTDLEARYVTRARASDAGVSFDSAARDHTEMGVDGLVKISDLLVNTSATEVRDVSVLCAAKLGLLARLDRLLVDVLVGGEYGSEGKGNLAYHLAPEYDVLVRVGGPNAGHKVPANPPRTHRSLPSGALSNLSAPLMIGAGSVVSPMVLEEEIAHLGVDPTRIHIDPQAMVISSADLRAEQRLTRSIRSTGQGVGAATARRITSRGQRTVLAKDHPYLKQFVSRPVAELLEDAFSRELHVLLEGTQGAGLSLFHGKYPHVTSRDTSAAACLSEAGIGPGRVRKIVMVVRSFPIRVNGAESGPMKREISWQTVADRSGQAIEDLLRGEKTSVTRRLRRVGEFDWELLRASAQLNTPTDIALTFADYIDAANSQAYRFEQLDGRTRQLIEDIEAVAAAPVSMITGRFTDRSVIDRRRWRRAPSHN